MIEIANASKRYSNEKDGNPLASDYAVKNINFALHTSELCALVGESGSGKSTLARMLCGLIAPTHGDVLLDGVSIVPTSASASTSRGKQRDRDLCARIQLVLQDGKSAIDPRFPVYKAIAEPIRNLKKLSKSEEERRIFSPMDELELPRDLCSRRAHELSGGQQKRVCIARALAVEPEIIIFDESVSGLDVLIRKQTLALIKRLHREHRAIYLFITHDMDVALYLANRVLVMQEGKIVEDRQFSGDISCFSHPYSRLLLDAMLPQTKTAVAI